MATTSYQAVDAAERETEFLIPGSRATFNFIVKSDRLLFTAESIAIHNVFVC